MPEERVTPVGDGGGGEADEESSAETDPGPTETGPDPVGPRVPKRRRLLDQQASEASRPPRTGDGTGGSDRTSGGVRSRLASREFAPPDLDRPPEPTGSTRSTSETNEQLRRANETVDPDRLDEIADQSDDRPEDPSLPDVETTRTRDVGPAQGSNTAVGDVDPRSDPGTTVDETAASVEQAARRDPRDLGDETIPESVEDPVNQAADRFSEGSRAAGSTLARTGPGPFFGLPAAGVDVAGDVLGRPRAGERFRRTQNRVEAGVIQGVGERFNVPAFASAGIEVAETGAFAARGIGRGTLGVGGVGRRLGVVGDETANLAARGGVALANEPGRGAGVLAGSTGAAAAVRPVASVRNARRVGGAIRRGDVDPRRFSPETRALLRDERAQADLTGRQRGEDTETTEITADDIATIRARDDPTRGGRFPSGTSGRPDTGPGGRVRSRDTGTSPSPSGGQSLGYRTARTEAPTARSVETADTPTVDVREVETLRRTTPETDLRTVDATTTTRRTGVEGRTDLIEGARDRQREAEAPEAVIDDDVQASETTLRADVPGDTDGTGAVERTVEDDAGQTLRERLDDATRSEATTRDDDRAEIGTRSETGLGIDTRPLSRTDSRPLARTDVRTDARGAVRTDARSDTRVAPRADTRLDTRADTRADTRVDTRSRQDSRRFDLDLDDGRRRSPQFERRDRRRRVRLAGDDFAAPGWLSETITDFAVPNVDAPTPTESDLTAAAGPEALVGEFPTGAQLFGSEATQSRIADVQATLGFKDLNVDLGGGR